MMKWTSMWTVAVALTGCLDSADERGGSALREDGFALCVDGGDACPGQLRCEDGQGESDCVAKPAGCGDGPADCACAAELCTEGERCEEAADGAGIRCVEGGDDAQDGPDEPEAPPEGPDAEPEPDGAPDPEGPAPGDPDPQERPYIEGDICYIPEPPILSVPGLEPPTVQECLEGLERRTGQCGELTFWHDSFGEGSQTWYFRDQRLVGALEWTDCNCFCGHIDNGAFAQAWGVVPPPDECDVMALGQDVCTVLGEGWVEGRGCVDLRPLHGDREQLEEAVCELDRPLTRGGCDGSDVAYREAAPEGIETIWLFDETGRNFARKTTAPEPLFCCDDDGGECRAEERITARWPEAPRCEFEEVDCPEE